jgi:hypothetical protein
MAHFARIEERRTSEIVDDAITEVVSKIVTDVIVVSDDVCPDPAPDNEAAGQTFIADVLGLDGTWLQTSYNGTFRGRYAGVGYTYDPVLDEFVAPPEIELEELENWRNWRMNNGY